MKVIIVGNGPAGNSIATKLDKAGVEVELYSNEAVGFYSRIRLPGALGDIQKLEALCAKSDPTFLKHLSVIAINKDEKSVLLSSGESSSYDKLVLATGSNARCFFTESRLKGIFTLRTFHDGVQLTNKLNDPVVVVGGGLLGLETALSINKLGYKVTVVEGSEAILSRQLDAEGSKLVSDKCLERENFEIICGHFIDKVEGNNSIDSVILKNGERLPCKTLVIAAGVIPSTSLAKNCNIDIDRAIIVDETCKTSDENIYAIGDCAQYNGSCPGLMPVALKQATAAYQNIMGEEGSYEPPTLIPTKFIVDGYSAECFGKTEGECISKKVGDRYEAWFVENKKLVGVILVGSSQHLQLAKKLINREVEDTTSLLDF